MTYDFDGIELNIRGAKRRTAPKGFLATSHSPFGSGRDEKYEIFQRLVIFEGTARMFNGVER
jgi:hypothetical protein